MNRAEFKVEITRKGYSSISAYADHLGIPRKRFFAHLKTGNFTQYEIKLFVADLCLSAERMYEIFFAAKVS